MEDLTVVVAGSGRPAADDVRAVLGQWAAAGLLRPFLWSEGPGAARAGDPLDDALPTVCWSASVQVVPQRVLDVLSGAAYEIVRLVALHVPVDDEDDTERTWSAAEAVERAVSDRLSDTQRLHRLSLVVPATAAVPLPHAVLSTAWDVNVLVAAEDRSTDRHATDTLRHPGNLAAHAALGVATICGLWPGMARAPFDHDRSNAGQQEPRVHLVRSFGRVIQASGLIERVAGDIFLRRRSEAWTAQAVDAVPASDPGLVVRRLADAYLQQQQEGLTVQPFAGRPAPRLEPAGWRESWRRIRWLVSRAGVAPVARPVTRLTGDAFRRLEDLAGHTTFGEDATVTVGLGDQVWEANRDLPAVWAGGTSGLARSLVDWVGSRPRPPAAVGTWRSLRALAFGLVDGGRFPEGLEPPEQGGVREIVTQVSLVAPDPAEEPFVFDQSRLWPQSNQAASLLEPIEPNDPAHARAARDALRRQRFVHWRPEPGPAPEAPGSFNEWLAARHGSLLWRVGDRIAADAETAQADLLDALGRVQRGSQLSSGGSLERAKGRLLIGLLALLCVSLVALVGGGAVWLAVALTLLVVPAGLAGCSLILHRHHRKLHAYVEAVERAEHAAGELVRLATRYEDYRDWADLIGYLLHHPEGGGVETPAARAHVEALPSPAALRFAAGETDDRAQRRLGVVAGCSLFHPGWLTDLYERCERELGVDADMPDPGPDHDLAGPPPRRQLLTQIRSGVPGARWARDLLERVGAQLADIPPDEVLSSVTWSAGATESRLQASAFLTQIGPSGERNSAGQPLARSWWTPDALASGSDAVTEVRWWLPSTMPSPLASFDDRDQPSTHRPFAERQAFMLASIRLDIVKAAPWYDLRVFGLREDTTEASMTDDLGTIG